MPVGMPPPRSPSSCGLPLASVFVHEFGDVFGGYEPRKDVEAAAPDREIVKAAAERDAAHLADAHAAPFGAELVGELFEHDYAVGDALQMIVLDAAGAIVEQQHGAVLSAEELLQREHLPAIAQGTLRDQPQLGQRVDHEALGTVLVHGGDQGLRGFPELHLGGVEYR